MGGSTAYLLAVLAIVGAFAPQATAATVTVEMRDDNTFDPPHVTVKAGDVVRFQKRRGHSPYGDGQGPVAIGAKSRSTIGSLLVLKTLRESRSG